MKHGVDKELAIFQEVVTPKAYCIPETPALEMLSTCPVSSLDEYLVTQTLKVLTFTKKIKKLKTKICHHLNQFKFQNSPDVQLCLKKGNEVYRQMKTPTFPPNKILHLYCNSQNQENQI